MKKVRRIYHIDDDDDDRYIFELALKEFDNSIRVIGEKDVEVALSDLSSGKIEHPDIIVEDWNMPKLNGWDCIIRIMKMEQCNEIPIVVLSTSSDSADKQQAESIGAYFCTKPSSIVEMSEKIKDMVVDISMRWLRMRPEH